MEPMGLYMVNERSGKLGEPVHPFGPGGEGGRDDAIYSSPANLQVDVYFVHNSLICVFCSRRRERTHRVLYSVGISSSGCLRSRASACCLVADAPFVVHGQLTCIDPMARARFSLFAPCL